MCVIQLLSRDVCFQKFVCILPKVQQGSFGYYVISSQLSLVFHMFCVLPRVQCSFDH